MPGTTVWEAICSLAGKDGLEQFGEDQIMERSAPSDEIVRVEIAQFLETGMIESAGEGVLRLSEAGRLSCSDLHNTRAVVSDSPVISGDREG